MESTVRARVAESAASRKARARPTNISRGGTRETSQKLPEGAPSSPGGGPLGFFGRWQSLVKAGREKSRLVASSLASALPRLTRQVSTRSAELARLDWPEDRCEYRFLRRFCATVHARLSTTPAT